MIACLLVLCVGCGLSSLVTGVKAEEKNVAKKTDKVATQALDKDGVFQMKVTFAGQELKEGSTNNITDTWSDNASKILNVEIERNNDVDVDPDKQYVLCLKTSDVFYFNGLPDVSKITGAEDVAMVQNPVPQVNVYTGTKSELSGFSKYSGEIRIKLNPSVETITVPDVGVSYNLKLLGYAGGTQVVPNPVQVQLVAVDKSLDLKGFSDDDKTIDHTSKADNVSVSTESLRSGAFKSAMSTDYFKNTVLAQDITLGTDGHISYYFGTSGIEWQVYKNLELVVDCPYVVVDGKKHYLDFSKTDTALMKNQKQYAKGYTPAEEAKYDPQNHTITYRFENIYLGGHTAILYTPDFTWPSDLKDRALEDDEKYVIQGVAMHVTEQKGYLGNDSTLRSSFTQNQSATFIPDQVNVKMASSAESGSDVAKRYIYKDVTRENGNPGILGFFDIHNEGTKTTPEINMTYKFNTGDTDAKYYVTRVNLATYREDSKGTDVSYVLTNGTDEKTGTKHYPNNSNFNCYAKDLRSDCGAGDDYYIQSISYNTYLQKGTKYHYETAHLKRNRVLDSGTFQGYLEGELNSIANATLKISSTDGTTPITADGKTEVTSTETSTVSDEDYIGMAINNVNIEGSATQSISAGSSVTLNVSGIISAEEYAVPGTSRVNGYHVLRDGIFYVCLPEGVSISGAEQVKIRSNGKEVPSGTPQRITSAVKVNGVDAYWWAIPANGLDTKSDNTVTAAIELSTSESMAGVVWDFSNRVALRAANQMLSWSAASTMTTLYNTVDAMKKAKIDTVTALADYLSENGETQNLGLEFMNHNASVKLNIARAEAKMDVDTFINSSESSASDTDEVTISKADSTVNYGVKIACTEEGTAKDFNYYIPITRTDSTIDTSALVCKKEIGLELSNKVNIKADTIRESGSDELPFIVYYTTDSGLNASSIRKDSVNWTENPDDYSKVTAVRISTKPDAVLSEGDSYDFAVPMQYDNAAKDFETQAGSVASWRSFGHYTYTRNGATTTNTYPCDSKSVRVRYVKDMRSTPIALKMDTGAANSYIDGNQQLPTTFVRDQKLTIKSVNTSSGTQLINSSPSNLTGADANSRFKISFNVNNISAITLPSTGSNWTVGSGKTITIQARGDFSKALTDVTTDRYVDVVLGNDDVNIILRIKLERKVAAASVDGSGVALGEQFQVPKVSDNCSISKDSAFTALYEIKNFIPGNYNGQFLRWQDDSGNSVSFPTGTTITMMEVDGQSKVTSYWYAKPTGSSVNLSDFTRMGGTAKYNYNTSSATATSLRYLFVVNFGQANAATGSYRLAFDAQAKSDVSVFTSVPLNVILGKTKSYDVSTSGLASPEAPAVSADYQVAEAEGNDSYTEGKSLSLVLTPRNAGTLPRDAQITYCGEKYSCNSNGKIILPLGTIESGTAVLKLTSDMFPEVAATYSFDGDLYLSNSDKSEAPMNGKKVATTVINFEKSKAQPPSFRITGTQVASQSDWSKGQPITVQPENLSGYTVTVTSYSGLKGSGKVTDLVSSVSGLFDFKDGVGIYNSGHASTGTLILSSTAKVGTYRLVFEVKDSEDNTVMTVPYYIVVR